MESGLPMALLSTALMHSNLHHANMCIQEMSYGSLSHRPINQSELVSWDLIPRSRWALVRLESICLACKEYTALGHMVSTGSMACHGWSASWYTLPGHPNQQQKMLNKPQPVIMTCKSGLFPCQEASKLVLKPPLYPIMKKRIWEPSHAGFICLNKQNRDLKSVFCIVISNTSRRD